MRHGKGKMVYSEEKVYEGEWKEDKMDGFGVMNSKGKVYEGEFKDGKMHGVGVLYPNGKDGKGKKGEWENGKRVKWLKD